MKNLKLLIFAILLLGFFACSNTELETYEGDWKLETITGGLTGIGYGSSFSYLNLDSNGNCIWSDSTDVIITKGTYNVTESNNEKTISFDANDGQLINSFDHILKELILVNTDSIYMSERCDDCYQYTFSRK